MPRPTTTPGNSNVRPGAVSMVSIPKRGKRRTNKRKQKSGLDAEYTEAAKIFPADAALNDN